MAAKERETVSHTSVDEYVDSLDETSKAHVREFVSFMASEFPGVKPRISYSMPMWWAGTKMYEGYVGISAAKKHYSLHIHDEGRIATLKAALPHCSFGKRCINISYDDEPAARVARQHVVECFRRALDGAD